VGMICAPHRATGSDSSLLEIGTGLSTLVVGGVGNE
jgi:hypothetical protein